MSLNFDNIQMAVVRKKSNGCKINISQINEDNRYDDYECIVCGSDVFPVVPQGKKTTGENSEITPHFKHLNADKCNSESFLHFWTKTEFIKIGDKFKVITDKENEFICNQIFFEKSYDVCGKKYKPDVTIYTSCGNIIHFEFNYTNSKKIKDYLDKWKELNHIIVEVNINNLSNVFFNTIPILNALYYDGKCFNLNLEDNIYYTTIGKYKLTQYDKNVLEKRKIEIEKLDWLWDNIRDLNRDKDFEGIAKILRSISEKESQNIAVDVIKRTKCNNMLQNYVLFLKDKVDKRLKLLNLKHDGYLLKYETEIPRLIYDRIYNGIMIKFYILGCNEPEIVYTYDYVFTEKIINDNIKNKINNSTRSLKVIHDKFLRIVDMLNNNCKIQEYKVHYKENTDYIDLVFIKDYRNKSFVFYDDNNDYKLSKDVFCGLINEDTKNVYISSYGKYLIETDESYVLKSYINSEYEFEKIFKQSFLNLTYKCLNSSFKNLPRYNFVRAMDELNTILMQIKKFKTEYKYSEDIVYSFNQIQITDENINQKIRNILYPMIYISNKINSDELNLILNKNFTNYEPWLIKDFIEVLRQLGIQNINNII